MLGKRKDFDNVPDSVNVVDENGLIPFDLQDLGGNVHGQIIYHEGDIVGKNEKLQLLDNHKIDVIFSMFMCHESFVAIEDTDLRQRMIETLLSPNDNFPLTEKHLL